MTVCQIHHTESGTDNQVRQAQGKPHPLAPQDGMGGHGTAAQCPGYRCNADQRQLGQVELFHGGHRN